MESPSSSKKKPSVQNHARRTSISHRVILESSFSENAPPSPQVFGLDMDLSLDEVKKQLEEEKDRILQEQSDTMKKLISEKVCDDKNTSILIETSNLISRQDTRIHKVNVEFLEKQLECANKQIGEMQVMVSHEQERSHRLETDLARRDARIKQMAEKEEEFKAEVTSLQLELANRNEKIVCLSKQLKDRSEEESSRVVRAEKAAEIARQNYKREQARAEKLVEENLELTLAVAAEQKKLTELHQKLMEKDAENRIKEEAADMVESRIGSIVANSTRMSSCHLLDEMKSISTQIINTPRTPSTPLNVRNSIAETQQIGKLISMLENSELKLKQAEEEIARLSKQLDSATLRVSLAEEEVQELQNKLREKEGSEELTYKYLTDEADKVKRQKADLRVDLMHHQKENEKLRGETERLRQSIQETERLMKESPVLRSVQDELTASLSVRAQLERESMAQSEKVSSLEDALRETKEQLNRCRDELDVALVDQSEKEDLKRQIEKLSSRLRSQAKTLEEVDSQCEQFRERKLRSDEAKKRALDEIAGLNDKMRELERSLEKQRSCESEVANLRAEKERLQLKNTYLQEELQEAHSDYRAELSSMAREISESKRREKDTSQSSLMISDLEHEIKVHEGTIRSMKRQLDEMKQDNEKIQLQMSDMAKREQAAMVENGKLRQGLADAVVKIEKYKKESEEAQELNQSLAEELAVNEEKIKKLLDEVEEAEDTVKEKEDLVSYLQSQVNAKQLPKVSRRSTLLSTVSDSDNASGMNVSIVNPQVVEALEEEKTRLKMQLLEKRRQLEERRDMPPPRAEYSRAEPSAPPRTPLSQQQNSHQSTGHLRPPAMTSSLVNSKQQRSMTMASSTANTTTHTMRHEIPHNWKMPGLALRLFRLKCSVCFTGIPDMKVRRCSYCHVAVHARCLSKVQNTCGMPSECAQFYMEQHSAPVGRMNGWIKMFRDDVNSREWQSAWALMDESSLSFYDQESAQGDLSKPFLKVDLAAESFVVRAGIDAPSKAEEVRQAASIIHVKMTARNLYLLAPSIPSAKRWTEALQTAQMRRSALTRKASSFSDNHCLLALHSPNNLTIHSVTVVDSFLLMGAQSGLFFSPVASSRMPSRVGGIDSVTAIEVLPDINTVALIAGSQRSLALVPLSALKTQLLSSQPAVQPDVISGYDHIHLLAYHEQDGNRFLIVADTTKLHILKYNNSRDVFAAHHSIATEESAMCVQSTSNGFFFGADSFYFVDMTSSAGRSVPTPRPLAPAHVADYPIAAMPIDNDEVLLAYQNYGMFVNTRGERTREATVEWEQMPMEFVYTAPYLYVIHYDSIEIMQVAGNTGSKSQTILDERRQVFTCENAHIVGRRQNGDVYISISNKEHTELHRFNSTMKPLKRKGISMATFSEKRTKVLS